VTHDFWTLPPEAQAAYVQQNGLDVTKCLGSNLVRTSPPSPETLSQRRVVATLTPSRLNPQHITITSYNEREKLAEIDISSKRAYQLAEQLISLARWIDRDADEIA
jgi:hypothetical protein